MTEKILVAVHGIGEQVRSETIQAVANQLCRYCGLPPTMPLGRFTAELIVAPGAPATEFTMTLEQLPPGGHGPIPGKLVPVPVTPSVPGAFLIKSPPDPTLPAGIGFGEVYWADIPRGPARNRYTLEEAKKWVRTVVERVRALDQETRGPRAASDTTYALAAQVLQEMIETTRVLGQLLFLAEKVTPFRFNLDDVLVNYLGDVQVVAEFANYRNQIVGLFQRVMARIAQTNPEAELYVVAHSEGTVIAFLGILEAFLRLKTAGAPRFDSPEKPDWAKQIRGVMTIGSPIDKHLFLWPHLWDGLGLLGKQEWSAADGAPVPWRNYFDYGDPIGYRLNRAREWLKKNGWENLFDFDFDPQDKEFKGDIAFTRYPFAGKAHTDYWQDEDVFGHFIQKVVRPTPAAARPAPAAPPPAPKSYDPPGNRWGALLLSPTLPYLVPFAILLLGVYLIYRAFGECLNLDEGAGAIWCSVLGFGALLAGITAAVRIPLLTRDPVWRLAGVISFAAGVAGFLGFLALGQSLEDRLTAVIGLALWDTVGVYLPPTILSVPSPILVFLSLVTVGTLFAYTLSRLFPSWGVKPIILTAGAVLVLLITVRLGGPGHYEEYQNIKLVLARAGLTGEDLEMRASAAFRLLAESQEQSGSDEAESPKPSGPEKAVAFTLGGRPVWPSEHGVPSGPEKAVAFTLGLLEEVKKEQHEAAKFKTRAAARRSESEVFTRFAEGMDLQPNQQVPPPKEGPIWPVFVAGALFLYLWWLAAMCFDLLVVWNYYVRESGVIVRLEERSPAVKRQAQEDA
jgi:hypothetical protein